MDLSALLVPGAHPGPITDPPVTLRLLPAPDSRPPARSWAGRAPDRSPLQPTLLTPDLPVGPDPRRGRVAPVLVDEVWTATPAAHLPDAASWSGQMARLLVETLHGQRPVGQLTRWVDERVLASVTVLLRARASQLPRSGSVPLPARAGVRPGRGGTGRRPPALQSVRVQCPAPEVLEVSVHVRRGHRSEALAFRLEGWYDRWLCTALEIGPRHSRGVEDS